MTVEPAVTDITECQACWNEGTLILSCCTRLMCPVCYVRHRESVGCHKGRMTDDDFEALGVLEEASEEVSH